MADSKYDAFDNLLYLAMRHFNKYGQPPRLVKLPIDEARMIIRCKHSGVQSLDQLMNGGIGGMTVEIVNDPDAKILFS